MGFEMQKNPVFWTYAHSKIELIVWSVIMIIEIRNINGDIIKMKQCLAIKSLTTSVSSRNWW